MKKSVKISAVVLALATSLLFTLTSAFALSNFNSGNVISDIEEVVPFLRASGGTYDSCFDFESGGTYFTSIDNQHEGYRGVVESGENHYWQMFNNGAEFDDPEGNIGHHYARVYANRSNDNFTFSNFDYLTYDIDVCADGYITKDGDLLYPSDFALEEETGYLKAVSSGEYMLDSNGEKITFDSLDLSYINGSYFYMQFNFSYSEKTSHGLAPAVDFVKENGAWCARVTSYGSGGSILDKRSIPINEGVGVFNHITTVISIDHSDAKNILMYFYLNGEYFATVAPFYTDSAASIATTNMKTLDLEYVGIVTSQYIYENEPQTEFSMGFDNIAIHGYKSGYKGALSSFMKATPTTSPLYTCEDVIYSGDYKMPYPNTPLGKIYTMDSELFGEYYIPYTAIVESMKYQYVAEIYDDVLNFVPPKDSPEFFVRTAGDAKFSLDPNVPYTVIDKTDSEGYYHVIPINQTTTAYWFLDYENQSESFIPDAEVPDLKEGAALSFPGKTPTPTPVAGEVGVFTTLVRWEYSCEMDEEGNDIWHTLTDPIVTKEMIDAEYVIIRAVYENMVAAFTVTDTNGSITPYINGEELDSVVAGCPTDSLITFYSDVTESSELIISQPVSFDLNGKTLTLSNSGNGIKTNHSSFSMYSSVVGGKVVFLGSCGFRVNATGTKNSPVFTLGREGDTAEDGYLTLTASTAFICQNASSGSSFGVIDIFGLCAEVSGTFLKYGYEVDLNVYDSEIMSSGILDIHSAARPHTLDAEFKNSTLIAINPNYNNHSNLFKDISHKETKEDGTGNYPQKTPSIVVEDCNLVGNLTVDSTKTPADGATITLKGVVMISSKTSALPEHCVVASGHVAEEYNKAVSFEYKAGDETKTFESIYNIKVSTGMKLNLTANHGFILNFHVPTAYRVNVYSDYEMQEEIAPTSTGNGYVTFTFKTDLSKTEKITFYALTEGNTEPSEYTLSLSDYFAELLSEETLSEETKALAVNAVNYCNEIYKFANRGESLAGYAEIIEANKDRLVGTDGLVPVDDTLLNTAFISAVQFIITEGNVPTFAFTKASDANISIHYGDSVIECTEITVLGVTYYTPSAMPVSDIGVSFEIYANGDKIAEYSIANYIEETNNGIAKALHGYGAAVKNYIPAQ